MLPPGCLIFIEERSGVSTVTLPVKPPTRLMSIVNWVFVPRCIVTIAELPASAKSGGPALAALTAATNTSVLAGESSVQPMNRLPAPSALPNAPNDLEVLAERLIDGPKVAPPSLDRAR